MTRGNPLTGPFFIEVAEPGDALVVSPDHLWPNRPIGNTSGIIEPNMLDPGYCPQFDNTVTTLNRPIDKIMNKH